MDCHCPESFFLQYLLVRVRQAEARLELNGAQERDYQFLLECFARGAQYLQNSDMESYHMNMVLIEVNRHESASTVDELLEALECYLNILIQSAATSQP